MTKKALLVLASLLLVIALAAACGGAPAPATAPAQPAAQQQQPAQAGKTDAGQQAAQAQAPKRGGVLKYGLAGDPPTLDPHVQRGAADATVKNMVYNRLATWDKDNKVVPDLAEKWEVADPKTINITLRQGVKFHNGEELTSDDVKFSIERILDPKTTATAAGAFKGVKVEAPDKYTVRLLLPAPDAAIFHTLARTDSLMVNRKWVEGGAKLDTQMMGTGPFKYKTREPNISFEVERFDDYFKKPQPYLDGIKFIPYDDETAKATALQTGQVDLIDYVPWRQMDAIENDAKAGKLKFYSDKQALFMTLYMNASEPPFNDKKVRQAVAWAIDREAVGKSIFFSRGEPMTGSFIPKPFIGYDEKLNGTYGFDQAKAKALLAEAGWKDSNGDGILDKNGQKMSINFLATNLYAMHYSLAELAQANLKEIGIDGKVELVDWPTRVKRRQAVASAEIQSDGLGQSSNDTSFFNDYFHSEKGVWPKNLKFKNAEVDKLLDQAQQTYDEKERARIYSEVDKKMLDEAYFVYVWRREQGEASQPYVMGFYHTFSVNSYLVLPEVWLNK